MKVMCANGGFRQPYCPDCGAWVWAPGRFPARCPRCRRRLRPPHALRMLDAAPHPFHLAPRPRLGQVWLVEDPNGPVLWVPGRGHLLAVRPQAAKPVWQTFPLPPGVREVHALASLGRRLLLAVRWEDEGPLPVLDPASGTWSAWSHEARAEVWSEPLVTRSGVWVLDGRARLWRLRPEGRVQAVRSLTTREDGGLGDRISFQPRLLTAMEGGVVARLPWGLVALDDEARPRWALHAPLPYASEPAPDLPLQPLLAQIADKRLMPPLYAHGWVWASLGSTLYRIAPQSGRAQGVLQAPRVGTWGAFLAEPYPTTTGVVVTYADIHGGRPGYTLALLEPDGEVRWRFPIVGWHPYFPPTVMGPWVLFLDRKEKTLLVLEEATGREVCRTSLPGIPDSPLALGEEGVYLLAHTPDGLRLIGLDAGLRPEDIQEEAWVLLHEQRDVRNAALRWLLQRRPVPAVLALEEAGEARTARDMMHHLPPSLTRTAWPILNALRQKAWRRAWDLALKVEDTETLAEIVFRWLAHKPEEAIQALVDAREHRSLEETWRERVDAYVDRNLPSEKAHLWQAARSRFWLMPRVVVTMEPAKEPDESAPTASAPGVRVFATMKPTKKSTRWRLRMENRGDGPAYALRLSLQVENGEVHPQEMAGPDVLQPGEDYTWEKPVQLEVSESVKLAKLILQVMGKDRWGRALVHPPQEEILVLERVSRLRRSHEFHFHFHFNFDITGIKAKLF